VLLVGAAVYAYQQIRQGMDSDDLKVGLWLVVYLLAILLMSGIGSFGGTKTIPAPWDSVIVAVIGLAAFFRGVHDARRHLAGHPPPEPEHHPSPAQQPA
jgi:peptidoglycan/LPS O-acetylase OafA/YrhL